MTIRVAINGYGRIGRNILRAFYESKKNYNIKFVAINDPAGLKANEYFTKYDTVHGKFFGEVKTNGNYLIINGDKILVLQNRNIDMLPWRSLDIDVVMECTGYFLTKKRAMAHINNGAKKVIISAPGGQDVDATIVYGINHNILKNNHLIISNSSCTTNCLAHLIKPLNDSIGVENGLILTIHAYTNDQSLTDSYHSDLRRGRSAVYNQIPTKTGAASSIGLILPELNGKLDGYAIRVPTINVSIVDLTFISKKITSIKEINSIMENASKNIPDNILMYNSSQLVSIDFNHNSASSIFDSTLTKVSGNLVKVSSWYDNEWGFSNRMLDTAVKLATVS